MNRILNVGGATRLDDISDAVTHVIVGDENKASVELKTIKSRGLWYVVFRMNKAYNLHPDKTYIYNFAHN